MAATTALKHNHHWEVLVEHCKPEKLYFRTEGLNVCAKTDRDGFYLLVFPPSKLVDPVIGLAVGWEELGLSAPSDKPVFNFDASGQYATVEVNGIGARIKVVGNGVIADVFDPATPDNPIRLTFAPWAEIEFADEETDIIEDIQGLYRSVKNFLIA